MLSAERVNEIFMDCLFAEGEPTDNYIRADGVRGAYGFHPERLEGHRQEVIAMLCELPDNFKQSTGGGWFFLNACEDKHGNQWTDLHVRVDQLFSLGIALGMVTRTSKDWSTMLPGGMPYYTIAG